MNTPIAAAHAIQSSGMIAIVVAIAAWLLAGSARLRWIGGVAVLALAPLVLAGSVLGDNESSLPQVSAPLAALAVVFGLVALGAAAWLFVKFPRAVLPVALATLPFRVPIAIGGESVKLLLPLYLTIAGAVLAKGWMIWRGRDTDSPRPAKLLDMTIVIFLALYALQSAYSGDVAVATQNFCFFYAPFVLLYGIAAEVKWDAKLLRACAATLVGVALVLVFAGYLEFARGEYLITPGGIKPNDFDPYFRVQSLFFDPNIYGRFVAVVMIVVAALMLFSEKTRRVLVCALVLALLWAGLVMSLSQSSFVSLLVGLIALAAMRWRAKPVLIASGTVLLVGLIFAVSFPSVSKIDLTSKRGAETSTSGRFDLVKGATSLWADKPIFGYGSGDFSRAFQQQRLSSDTAFGSPTTTKSHTAPLTVAAEQGIVGFLAFLALLAAAFAAVYRRVGREDSRPGVVARIAVAAAFTALFVHSLAYAAFVEDPLTWTMLGAAVSLAAIPRPARDVAPEAEDETQT
jgi:O-antigen ligase